jgi:hypothetical protein
METPVSPEFLGATLPNDNANDPRWRFPAWQRHIFHKPDFWRLCFHFWKRATLVGHECCHKRLGLCWVDFDDMLREIEPEIIELLDMPLWKVARRPMPRNFEKLFDIDLSQLHNKEATCQPN